ncbi:WYL domain-containing protein [Microbulbifer thermotolerans]|uniref:Transcriptional regulator n=1 Tax=Microbulbifer thermotolerans TaxID=252514 RepID=A0A143HJM0_MICTH|nr:WYL domain-containing protein [Microbulbifer thermotolerans]AMX01707.1 transcriptional regulator [Microbulbifer thermotolerans]MCX2779477.1 WYL domain-containing protein [Microbulbifer thermotolerans]MCX2793348.1 WYL domain-containing protein [Microbulbifer thermotolerans]MCX2801287.1 WYL domain-containing protein [Microbulbifer thermotolerans]MCX2806078.1 WYL domain-containing protein [Microbulbifer thermotolerans]
MEDPQQRRFWLIELIAYWEGRLNTRHLREFFGVTRQCASKDINDYRDICPGNLRDYCPREKGYTPSPDFQRHYISADVAEYLNWMAGLSARALPADATYSLPNCVLRHPARNVTPQVMRPLVRAIREGRRVEVDYGSISNPNGEGRIIVPHTFVNTGLRWHLRAWCEKNRQYRDFVLSRFLGQPEVLDQSPHTAEADIAWNTEITLVLEPDARLTPEKKAVLEHDYNMEGGQLCLKTRAALASYLLKEMQVNTKMLDGRPEAQQLVLVNEDDVKEWLF